MSFRRNYLPSQSQPWAREVQSRIQKSERDSVISDINNKTRDDQLQASYNRLDTAFGQLASQQSTLESQQSQLQTALNNSTTALNTAVNANNNALAALQDVVDLGSPGGPTINAANITAGSISAINISGSQITGSTLTTAFSGQRVTLNSNEITFNNGSVDTGSIFGSTESGGQAATFIDGNACVISSSYATFIRGDAGVYKYTGGAGDPTGNFSAEADIVSVGGSIRRQALAGQGTTGASITDGGNFVRTSSSERYKTEIQLLDINLNDLYAVEPKTFKRIEEVEEHGEDANVYPGLIAEELAGTSLDKFVFYSNDEEGNPRPEGIHYPELTTALLIALKDLNTRVEELENKVK